MCFKQFDYRMTKHCIMGPVMHSNLADAFIDEAICVKVLFLFSHIYVRTLFSQGVLGLFIMFTGTDVSVLSNKMKNQGINNESLP